VQELQVQEGGDVSFLSADYQALLSDTGPVNSTSGSQSDQQAAANGDAGAADKDDGLEAAVESIKRLFQDCCRFSTGATAAVQRQLPGLEKLLRSDAAGVGGLQGAVEYMLKAI
jgi:hypothetical protein